MKYLWKNEIGPAQNYEFYYIDHMYVLSRWEHVQQTKRKLQFQTVYMTYVILYSSQIKIHIGINSKNALGESLRPFRLIIHYILIHILLDI